LFSIQRRKKRIYCPEIHSSVLWFSWNFFYAESLFNCQLLTWILLFYGFLHYLLWIVLLLLFLIFQCLLCPVSLINNLFDWFFLFLLLFNTYKRLHRQFLHDWDVLNDFWILIWSIFNLKFFCFLFVWCSYLQMKILNNRVLFLLIRL